MRIALISDIHSNLVALEAVLADIAAQGVERIVCLGDVGLIGPQQPETIARLRALDCPVVIGNCDAWMLDPLPVEPKDEDGRKLHAGNLWAASQLTPEDHDYVRSFQPVIEIPLDDDGGLLLCYHGSPRSFDEQIVPSTSDEQLMDMFAGTAARVYAGGHTHQQMLRRHGQSLVVNPGSVGLPFDRVPPSPDTRNPAWAEYAILTMAGEQLSVDLRRVPFDLSALVRAAYESGMPHVDWWVAGWGAAPTTPAT